jgi:hypothetical protein
MCAREACRIDHSLAPGGHAGRSCAPSSARWQPGRGMPGAASGPSCAGRSAAPGSGSDSPIAGATSTTEPGTRSAGAAPGRDHRRGRHRRAGRPTVSGLVADGPARRSRHDRQPRSQLGSGVHFGRRRPAELHGRVGMPKVPTWRRERNCRRTISLCISKAYESHELRWMLRQRIWTPCAALVSIRQGPFAPACKWDWNGRWL